MVTNISLNFEITFHATWDATSAFVLQNILGVDSHLEL
jgi:hypothetical protein